MLLDAAKIQNNSYLKNFSLTSNPQPPSKNDIALKEK